MDFDRDKIHTVIDKAVRPDGERKPVFYAITGSHIYGFPSHDSDVDVRGFHIAPMENYAMLRQTQEQVIVNQDGLTDGFEEYENVDLVSYELRKFTRLIYKANFNVLELIFDGAEVMNGSPMAISGLQKIIEDNLPLDTPKTYLGMAKSNYYKFLNPDKDSYEPKAKKFLYVIRGLYAAEYVVQEEDIVADVKKLTSAVDGDEELVNELIEKKLDGEQAYVSNELATRAHDHIAGRFNELGEFPSVDKSDYRNQLDDWMMKVRQ